MRLRSSSPLALVIEPLPPTPSPSATSPVDVKREPTPFDELPMSHLISFPVVDSPTSTDQIDTASFDNFQALQQQYAYQSSASLLRDAFDPYYRLSNSNPTPISDALNMNLHGVAFKPQLHSHAMQDLSGALSFNPPQQQHLQQQPCIPTSQLFPGADMSPSPSVKASSPEASNERASPTPTASTSQQAHTSQTQKKRPPRATISTKDFVPPDVSGLTKREARLVKNRAAAFLSRQRKREEFECMEVRVAQLEQENARLLALTQQASRSPSPSRSLEATSTDAADNELASLRSQLSQSRARAAELENEINRLRLSGSSDSGSDTGPSPDAGIVQIKRENVGADLVPKRSGASLFGVVLLCALPSLLSLPAPTLPYAASRFSFTPGPGASVSHNRPQAESLLDWTGMDLDESQPEYHRKIHLPLSFLNGQSGSNGFLQHFAGSADSSLLPFSDLDPTEAEFDISLLPSTIEGKIRVRIEAPLPSSSTTSESGLTFGGSSPRSSLGSGSPSFAHTSPPAADSWDLDFTAPEQQGFLWDGPSVPGANVDIAMPFNQPGVSRRKVRIALKNLPTTGTEAGEWEVDVS